MNGGYTAEQSAWIKENVRAIEWRNTKHFADTFNALFGTEKKTQAINCYLNRNGMQLLTKKTAEYYTSEMDEWLVYNYNRFNGNFVELADHFNSRFGTDYSNCRLMKRCERTLKIHKPKSKKNMKNSGKFKADVSNGRGLPIGTIRYNSDGRPFIKVLESDGKSGSSRCRGHNYREPWWMPLQKKIWIDHYGEVPEGYRVVSLNGNPEDTDIKNIGLIDVRGTAVMSKKGWWTDNTVITADGVQWCNLYYTAKDNGVV